MRVSDVIKIFDVDCKDNVFYNVSRIRRLVRIVIGEKKLLIMLIVVLRF